MTIKRTDWFPGYVKPARVGVYERYYGEGEGGVVFCKWDGKRWMCSGWSIDDAAHEGAPSDYQSQPWRGLAADPNGDNA